MSDLQQQAGTMSVAAIMTVHAEGAMAAVSYNSLLQASAHAESAGIEVHKLIVLDNPTPQTLAVFQDLDDGTELMFTEFGDQGLVRNAAAEACKGDLIAFLDGDDLWGENWLTAAHAFLEGRELDCVAHPEFNWFFQGVSSVLIGMDQEDPNFDINFLRFGNYWDAMCMAHRSIHLASPYCKRRIKEGFAFEDWHWNCETVNKGIIHKLVPDTIHFKRRRENSQTLEASGTKALMPQTPLTAFAS